MWLNVSVADNKGGSLPSMYRTRSEYIPGLVNNGMRRSYYDQTAPMLVPPKFRGTPLDILTELKGPYDIDFMSNGLMVISEFCGHSISIWDLSIGKRINRFGGPGTLRGQFCYPAGVAITPRDTIMVADCYNDRVQELTIDGQVVSFAGEHGSGPLQFNKPRGITFDTTGLVYVADRYNHRIQVLNPDLSYSHSFGGYGAKPGQFNTPYDIAFDDQGLVYVTDCGNNRIQIFTCEGHFTSQFGVEGKKHGELNGPTGISVDDGIVYIAEYLNSRVSMYSTQGYFIDVKMHKKVKDPYGIMCNSNYGHLVITDFSHNRVVILERKG